MMKDADISNSVILNNIHESIDFGIHLEANIRDTGIRRSIKQIVCFDVENDESKSTIIYDGKLHLENLTTNKRKKLKLENKK